jgi:two-component system chemotaxis response regulator CheY
MTLESSRSYSSELKILVADDHSMIRSMVKSILHSGGFDRIFQAETGVDAVQLVIAEEIDLVICDWNMPKGTGLEVLQQLRADARFRELPFLMLTAEGYRENVLAASKAGATEFIVKPFTADVLLAKVDQMAKHIARNGRRSRG